ncbi:GTPase HflX [Candidatus Bathyarchaeota archaeon]|nr:GTPase HflX [Candidatus Bathyarchaeota archaeon]
MRAVVVECLLPNMVSRVGEVSMMAENIGYAVVESLVQRRNSVHHSHCIGAGKLEELKRLVRRKRIDLVIFTNTLPSSQVFKIQRRIGDVKVIDRNLLILEVFSKRAMTKEAKLQIELAKLRYTFSWGREFIKLKGILGEQVGWSGPGDYPFKEYEKAARRRIRNLRMDLQEVQSKKTALRQRRHELGFPIVALAGYTQSGKTTFFNRLTEESKDTGLGPFTTLSSFSRLVKWRRTEFILVDSIGFIEEMHPMIVDAFFVTLDEITNADLILLFVDVSEPIDELRRKVLSIESITRRIEMPSRIIVCANKIDLVDVEHAREAIEVLERYMPGRRVSPLSAKTGEYVDSVLDLAVTELGLMNKTVQQT